MHAGTYALEFSSFLPSFILLSMDLHSHQLPFHIHHRPIDSSEQRARRSSTRRHRPMLPSTPASPEPEPEPSGRSLSDGELVEELLGALSSARGFKEFRRPQRKECFNLQRWLQLLLPLLQELRDRDREAALSDDAYRRLALLSRAFHAARRLLRCCHDGSKIFLSVESEAVLGRFRAVYEKIHLALDGMPFSAMGVSDEVKEQVELTSAQLKRSKRRAETQDMELAMDCMVIQGQGQGQDSGGGADRAILQRLAVKLELQSLADLRAETMAVKKLVKERSGQHADSTAQIVGLLGKLKAVAGVDEKNILGDVSIPRYLEKCPSLVIPGDFLCPISLEIMADPVIIATGRTYERRSIQRWLDAGQRTCPKTQQPLAHLSLAPNLALKNLILQWCHSNGVEIQAQTAADADADADEDDEDSIPSLVKALSSAHLDVQRNAVRKIRALSKESPHNRALITDNAGIPALVALLPYPDKRVQENTVTALLNLSIDEANKALIAEAGAIPFIVDVLRNGSVEGQENSAAALFSLSMLDGNRVAIGALGGIPPLVSLLRDGTARGKKDAATAIFNLVLNHQNKLRAMEAGVVAVLLGVLDDGKLGMVDEALSIFLLLATHPACRREVATATFVEVLVQHIKEGAPKTKECALSLLLELGLSDDDLMRHALGLGLHDHLSQLAITGTSRAQRKANSFMQLARNLQ